MRKGKIIVSMVIAVVLVGILAISLLGCDLFSGTSPSSSGGGENPIGGGSSIDDGGDDSGDDDTEDVTPTRPSSNTRPTRPTDTNDSGSGSGGGSSSQTGTVSRTMDQYLCIATLLGGTRTSEGEGKYRILNMYADIVQREAGEATTTTKRLVFRTNVDTSGNRDSEYVVKMIDMSGIEADTDDLEDTEDSESVSLVDEESGSVTVGASVTVGQIEEEQAFEDKGELIWALYVIDGKMYLDKGDDQPLLYFEDFDMDYVNAIASNLIDSLRDEKIDGSLDGDLFKMLDDLMGSITINKILGILKSFIFPSMARVTITTDDLGNQTAVYSLEIGLNSFINQISKLVGTIFGLGLFTLPFDLQLDPLMTFLKDITPQMKINIVGTTYKAAGESIAKTLTFGLEVKDNNPSSATYNEYLLDFDLTKTTVYSSSKIDLGIPQKAYDATSYEPFSLTNIALSLDLIIDSDGELDVGSVINSFMGQKALPEETIIVNAATGFRLDLMLDADLNYGKEVYTDENGKEQLVDNNFISLELYLIDTNSQLVDEEALIAIYYMDGSVYANLGHLLERYYSGSNIKINLEGIPDVIQYVVDLVTNALDGIFVDTLKWSDWVTWNELWNSKYGTHEQVSTAEETLSYVTASDINVVSLATDEYGHYHVSTNLITFLKAVGAVVGLGDIFSTNDDQTAIVITVNTILFNGIAALAGDLGFTLPDGLAAELAINFADDGSIDSITISAALDSRVGFTDEDGYWYIGTKTLYKPLIFTEDGTKFYSKATCIEGEEYTFTETDPKDNYDFIYVYDDKLYADAAHTIEIMLGYNVDHVAGAYRKTDAIATGIKSSDLNTTWTVSAYIYKGYWVIGYGLEEGKYIKVSTAEDTYLPAKGLNALISIHDMMFCYTTDYLAKFDPEKGGTSYKGFYGASSNIEGYILSKTHTRQRVNLTSTSEGLYYVYNAATKEYTLVNVGSGEGQTPWDAEIEYYQIVENPYVDSISKWINTLLEGTFFSLNLAIDFSAGKYNLAPLISLFLPEIADKQLIWEFTGDFTLDASLNIGISLNKENPDESYLVLELVANKDIKIAANGTNPEMLLFGAGKTILGLYGVGTKVYVELENVKLLNITLPNLSMELDYTTLLYNLIGEKEIFDLTFNIMDLINGSDEETSETSQSEELSQATEPITPDNLSEQFTSGNIVDALAVLVNSDVVAVAVTVGGLQKLLETLNVDLGDIVLTDIMDLSVALVLNRTAGVYLDITGALVPKYNEETEQNEFDDDLMISLRLATDAEYKQAQDISAFAAGVQYYTKDVTTGNYSKVAENAEFDSEVTYYTLYRVASPVQIGDIEALLKGYETKFETLEAETDKYYDDLVQALLKVIGDLQLTITIDANVLNSLWDINKIIDTIVADRADSFALPINVRFDEWATEVQLAVQWYLDLNNFKNTQILVEIRYEGNVWIGLYVYSGSIVLDLNGIGLFDVELTNLKVVSQLGDVINSLMSSIGDLSLTSLLGGLIDDLLNPAEETSNSEEVAEEQAQAQEEQSQAQEDTSDATEDTSDAEETKASNDLISMLLASLSIQNTTIMAHLTADVFEAIFRELLGFSMYLEFDVGAEVDIKEGRLEIEIGVERSVFADITLQVAAGDRGAYKFEKDLDEIPNWNAISGEYLITSILKNLELGLYIDLNQYTPTSGSAQYTRIYIEKLDKTITLDGANGTKASKGSILVTLASIDLAEFNNAGTGSVDPLLYAELNYNTGKLNLVLYPLIVDILGDTLVGIVNGFLGDDMKNFAFSIDLDLVTMLSGTLDGLIDQITALVTGLITPVDETTSALISGVTNINVVEEVEVEEEEATFETINAVEVVSSYEWSTNINGNTAKAGKYYYYNTDWSIENGGTFRLVNEDGSYSDLTKAQVASVSTLPTPTEELLNYVYYVVTVNDNDTPDDTSDDENVYTYYICKNGDTNETRRTYSFYQLEVVSGISGLFADLDIIGLFDMLDLYLTCDAETKIGVLNADISVNTYQFNYLIDHLMYYLFGPETILNLEKMTADAEDGGMQFSSNHLAYVYWDRQNADNFLESLWDRVDDILSDIAGGAVGTIFNMLKGTVHDSLFNVLSKLLPFAVSNETHLGLNLVRGQLTNIYLTNDDKNENILDPDGNPYTFKNGSYEVSYNKGRSDAYFTNLYIFNTSPSIGNSAYTGVEGAITWDNTPTTITYNPYMYTSDSDAAEELYNAYFGSGHVATYQKATNLYKAEISFVYEGTSTTVTKDNLADKLANPDFTGVCKITATAPFNSGASSASLTITIKVQGDADSGAAITEIDEQKLFVYQDFPAYIFFNAADGSVRRVETSALTFASTKDGSTPDLDDDGNWTINYEFAYVNPSSDDGSWEQTLLVKFPNGTIAPMNVIYKNSSITNVIIAGADNNTINIDLYQFDPSDTLANYTPEKLYFTYSDGTADNIAVDEWAVEAGSDVNELFNRVKAGSSNYGSVEGAVYKLYATVAKGTQNEQVVEMTFNVPSRQVTSVSFGTRTNMLDIQPYEYYLYLSNPTKYANYNPYQDVVTVNYDTYSDNVYVEWSGISSNIDYSWDIDKTKTSIAQVILDSNAYPSGDIFYWSQDVSVTVSRNQIQGIYFDEKLTQTTLVIDPYAYHNKATAFDYYPSTVYVKFTNGKVLEMPVAWQETEINSLNVDYATDYTQFTATIGFDIDQYNEDHTITGYKVGTETPFLQTYTVNVKVDGIGVKGIVLEGSEFMGGTYKIDPVAVNFQNQSAFPSSVSVVYANNTVGSMQVVKWELFDANGDEVAFDRVKMDQQINLTAKCWLTNDLYFIISAEVLDRSASMMTVDTSEITAQAINPYAYTLNSNGTITYDVFESTMDVQYATSFTVSLKAKGTGRAVSPTGRR